MLCALACLPPNDVVQGFDDLVDLIRANYDNDVEDLLEHFEDTYIGRIFRHTSNWVMQYIQQNRWRTAKNNNVEGWHRSFQGHLTSFHPIFFWKFLQVLQNEESLIWVRIMHDLAEHPSQPQRRRYLDCNRRILTIADDFPNRETFSMIYPYLSFYLFLSPLIYYAGCNLIQTRNTG